MAGRSDCTNCYTILYIMTYYILWNIIYSLLLFILYEAYITIYYIIKKIHNIHYIIIQNIAYYHYDKSQTVSIKLRKTLFRSAKSIYQWKAFNIFHSKVTVKIAILSQFCYKTSWITIIKSLLILILFCENTSPLDHRHF